MTDHLEARPTGPLNVPVLRLEVAIEATDRLLAEDVRLLPTPIHTHVTLADPEAVHHVAVRGVQTSGVGTKPAIAHDQDPLHAVSHLAGKPLADRLHLERGVSPGLRLQ